METADKSIIVGSPIISQPLINVTASTTNGNGNENGSKPLSHVNDTLTYDAVLARTYTPTSV